MRKDLAGDQASAAAICSALMGPARRMLTVSAVQSTTVDEAPPGALPPSKINGINEPICVKHFLGCNRTGRAGDVGGGDCQRAGKLQQRQRLGMIGHAHPNGRQRREVGR